MWFNWKFTFLKITWQRLKGQFSYENKYVILRTKARENKDEHSFSGLFFPKLSKGSIKFSEKLFGMKIWSLILFLPAFTSQSEFRTSRHIDPQPMENPSFLNPACLLSTDEGTEQRFEPAGCVSMPSTRNVSGVLRGTAPEGQQMSPSCFLNAPSLQLDFVCF